jgi:PAS domain S-box-containing protein
MLGYPGPESLIGRSATDFIAESHRSQFTRNIEQVIAGKSPLRKNQWPHLAKNGQTIWLEGHPRRITWRGRPALLSTLVDITETRLREVSALAKSAQLAAQTTS